MPESDLHRFYITKIIEHIDMRYCVQDSKLILTDLADNWRRPPQIANFVPDVYYSSPVSGVTIVGEAKSTGDILTSRSRLQILAFIEYCRINNGIFIVAVPWDEYPTAVNLVKNICNRIGIEIEYSVLKFLPR